MPMWMREEAIEDEDERGMAARSVAQGMSLPYTKKQHCCSTPSWTKALAQLQQRASETLL